MILAAYLVTGFLVASVYAVGMLRGRRDRHHRLGLLIPLTVACIPTPIQFIVGDTAAREIAGNQPIKFAGDGMRSENIHSGRHRVHLRGLHRRAGSRAGSGSPGSTRSWSVEHDTQVTGLDSVPADDRPPVNTMLHWAFDTMVGICTLLIALGALVRDRLVA